MYINQDLSINKKRDLCMSWKHASYLYLILKFNFQVFNVSRRRSRAVLNELSGRYIQNKKGRSKVWEKVNFITIKNNSWIRYKQAYPSYFTSHSLPLYKSSTLEVKYFFIPLLISVGKYGPLLRIIQHATF